MPQRRVKTAHLFEHLGQDTRLKEYDNGGDAAFEWIKPNGFGALMSLELANTVFNQLFIRHQILPEYFQAVELNTPAYQLWKVGGDAL